MSVEFPDHWNMAPSSAKQWVNCHGSIKHPDYARLAAEKDKAQDPYHADRGSLGHAIACATLGGPSLERGHHEFFESMEEDARKALLRAVETCVNFVRQRYQVSELGAETLLELKIKDDMIDEHGGTMDVLIVTPTTLDVTDFKFGRHHVAVERNEQIGCYLNLARQRYPKRRRFFGSIVQPWHHDGVTYEWTAEELDDLAARTLEASMSNTFKASDEWCVWCPLLSQCETAAAYVAEEIKKFPDLTEVVNDVNNQAPTHEQLETMSKIFRVGKLAEDMTKGANKIIKRYATLGADLASVQLSIRVTPRQYWREDVSPKVVSICANLGYDGADVTTPPGLITPAELRKLMDMDKEEFNVIFGHLIDTRDVEALSVGKECKREFPEFNDLTT